MCLKDKLLATDFLGEYEKERLATIRPLTMKVEPASYLR